ncbi:MAG: bifunctional nicotinamidase/pyrazinamidase [Verrucomicrobiales bacterium]
MNALILVDVQNDFMPGGPLAVADGDAVVPVLNAVMGEYDFVVATQDWHPADHSSFASRHEGLPAFSETVLDGLEQTLWPDHCVQGTEGAAFHPELDLGPVVAIFRKGVDRGIDSYSGFFDNGRRRKTGLDAWLRGMDVTTVHIGGLAAEICVAYTAADARRCGFRTAVLEDATRPFDSEAWAEKADELREAGVAIETSAR